METSYPSVPLGHKRRCRWLPEGLLAVGLLGLCAALAPVFRGAPMPAPINQHNLRALQPGMTPREVQSLLGPPMWSADHCGWTGCDDKPWPGGRTRWRWSNPDPPFRWHPNVEVYFLDGRVNEVRATRHDLWGVDHELVYLATHTGVIEPNDFAWTFKP
jgi:hypothetical protein